MVGERILIVEDERSVACGLADGLEKEGFSTFLAQSGQEAFNLVRKKIHA
jgi:DNA-binding response OmpR family regulator